MASRAPDEYSGDFYTSQNRQLGRVCRAYDPLVTVLYVSAIPLHAEIPRYYYNFLRNCYITDAEERVKFLVPAHGINVRTAMYTTSKLLSLAFKTLSEIRGVIRGRRAVLIPGELTEDDITIADLLEIPILAPDLETAREFTGKVAARQLFKAAGVPVPQVSQPIPSYSAFYSQFARLIFSHLDTDVWVLKMDEPKQSKGLISVDLRKSKLISTLRSRYEKAEETLVPLIEQELRLNIHQLIEYPIPTL